MNSDQTLVNRTGSMLITINIPPKDPILYNSGSIEESLCKIWNL